MDHNTPLKPSSRLKQMPADRKKELLKLLRKPADEGGYLQGSGWLVRTERGKDNFCCLGVASDQCVKVGLITWDEEVDLPTKAIKNLHGIKLSKFYDEYKNASYPGAKVLNYWGLSVKAAEWLAFLNDDGYTFVEIADAVEKYL